MDYTDSNFAPIVEQVILWRGAGKHVPNLPYLTS